MKIGLFLASVLVVGSLSAAEQSVRFDRDVRPILADRCFHCHGPNEDDREADLRLDKSDGPDGAYRTLGELPAITPGSPEQSELWHRITADDDDIMPPPDSSEEPLSDEEKQTIKLWIEDGAAYTAFWAFAPPRRPSLPEVDDPRWRRNPIDRFVYARLVREGIEPNAPTDRRTLVRRLYLDLTGLPPTRAQVHEFLADTSASAYERLVDRLLDTPQYGEHMTKYWLDLVRFADTNGIHHDHYRDMSPYRDWVIRAFNDNLPYSDFVKYQLAGDLYPEPTRDQLVASGFNRLHLIIDRGTALPEESYTRNVLDRVTAVGTAFMGLTVQCAVCHDHKYDPMTMRDFYQLFAFFNNIDAEPETGGRQGSDFERGLQPPYISLATKEQEEQLAALTAQVEEAKALVARCERQLAAAKQENKKTDAEPDEGVAKNVAPEGDSKEPKVDGKKAREKKAERANQADAGKGNAEQAQLVAACKAAKSALAKAEGERKAFEATIPMAMVMKERAQPRPAFIFIRGAYDKPGDPVERNTPAFLPPMKKKDGLKTRMDLAEWFVSREQPLTARVAVNRFWQQIFGVGIVKTAEDFGAQGEWPSHPALLDYLTVSFVESGWNVKALMKQIVMSETYRQSSVASPAAFTKDPENRLLARGSRYRLDAEVIRDQVLATSGLLNKKLYGKSVKPPQPAGLWEAVSMPSSYPRVYEPDTGDKIYRRSLYTFWKRGMPPPQMTILNAPTREACIARRERTNTPLQALLLLNEPEYLKAARHLACKTLGDTAIVPGQRLGVLFETLLARLPDQRETAALQKLLDDLKRMYASSPALAKELTEGVTLPAGVTDVELAAWTMVASTLYNLDITRTRN